MPAVSSALVIGGGLAGAATAIGLAQAGVAVDLVEVRPAPSTEGSGITLAGNALRVLRDLGVWEAVEAAGYGFNSLGFRAPDAEGTLVASLPDARSGGPDLPATVGMSRPELARLLLDRAADIGAKLRFGTTASELVSDASGVEVTLTDGSAQRYDLVIGADGVRSATRSALGVSVQTRMLGMGIWRVQLPRPAEVVRTDLVYGGRCYIAGYCPTGEDHCYAYLVEEATDRSALSHAEQLAVFTDLASAYHGPWDNLRVSISTDTPINYTWFETHFLDGPWNRGRVVLIGDAAHACPPTIAQGGAMALEDAAVLVELVLAADTVDDDLWAAFAARRGPRAKAVVDASVQISAWMVAHEQGDAPGTIARIAQLVSERP